MKPALEPDINIRFETATLQRISRRQRTFACSLHQLPVSQRHRGNAGLYATRHHVRIGPIRVDRRDAYDTGAHGHDFCRAIRPQGDCLDCHDFLLIPALWYDRQTGIATEAITESRTSSKPALLSCTETYFVTL